jgi:hypothetical protein
MISFAVEDGTGLSGSTSYVSVEEADNIAVLNIHNSDEWLELPLEKKRNLLMYTTLVLDSRTTWRGIRTTDVQALAWPRTGVVDNYKNTLSPTAIPYNLRVAVVELAKHTLTEDRLSKWQPESIVSEIKVDTIAVKFANAGDVAMGQYKVPEIVTDLLTGLGSVRNSTKKVTFGKLIRQ